MGFKIRHHGQKYISIRTTHSLPATFFFRRPKGLLRRILPGSPWDLWDIPKHLVDESVLEQGSDRYYKTMTTYKQLVFLLYGVVMRCKSLNNLCKNLLLLEDKLTYLGINELPAVSTLSDANINGNSKVFATIYQKLYEYYKETLKPSFCHFKEGLDSDKIFCFDSSTITLFTDIFKGAGRNSLTGKKKGGIKVHTKMPLTGFVPDLVTLTQSACADKTFLPGESSPKGCLWHWIGQLKVEKGDIYIFDKGYAHYQVWKKWTEGVFYITRLNENANYAVLSGQPNHVSEYANGGIISDQRILLKGGLEARLVVFKDYMSGKVLRFVSNLFDYDVMTIVQLYKYRWNIEVLFKQLKQNFELCYFFFPRNPPQRDAFGIGRHQNTNLDCIDQHNSSFRSFTGKSRRQKHSLPWSM